MVTIKIEKIIKTKRKTISLQVTDDATLIIRAPFNIGEDTINKVVMKHKNWIEKKKKEIGSRDPKHSYKEFVNGEGFLYLGKYYKLKIVDEQDTPLKFENGFYLSKKAVPKAREIFIKWYKKRAYEKISERIELYSKKGGFEYNKINITNAQKRWASCSSKNNLNFSWRLIMAPINVIDYVVVHELVHIREKNHTTAFWKKVKTIIPDYEKHKEWLKRNGYLFRI